MANGNTFPGQHIYDLNIQGLAYISCSIVS